MKLEILDNTLYIFILFVFFILFISVIGTLFTPIWWYLITSFWMPHLDIRTLKRYKSMISAVLKENRGQWRHWENVIFLQAALVHNWFIGQPRFIILYSAWLWRGVTLVSTRAGSGGCMRRSILSWIFFPGSSATVSTACDVEKVVWPDWTAGTMLPSYYSLTFCTFVSHLCIL